MQTLLIMAVAFGLGLAIGLERQWRQRNAGLRTNVLVAVGAAAFCDLGTRLNGVNRRPMTAATTEAAYRVLVVCSGGWWLCICSNWPRGPATRLT